VEVARRFIDFGMMVSVTAGYGQIEGECATRDAKFDTDHRASMHRRAADTIRRPRLIPVTERSLSYAVSVTPERHLVNVTLTVRGKIPEPLIVAMPVWTPGSYLVREYSRHVEGLRARSPRGPCGVRKVSKESWAVAHGGADEVVVEYSVYAHELTVRTNHVSDTHAFWNGASTYVRPVEDAVAWDALPIDVTITPPKPGWHIATSLAPVRQSAGTGGARRFRASSFDDLVDCPVEVGLHEKLEFTVRDKAHEIVIWGTTARIDRAKLVHDVSTIVATEADLFGGLPYERYLFILHLAPGGRGGLEHRTSSALLASPDAFDTSDGYDDLLSLFAHEFFHLWQVKRTRPRGIHPYDYARENYTRLLWLFEGGTSYYDWLVLRKAGLVDAKAYLKHLGSEIARLEDTPGRHVQSLEDASFDAWIKLYRPDEHSVNSTVSYYLKGEIVCALLDLEIRQRSKGAKSFDDVMRLLWAEYGARDQPVSEANIESVIAAATGVDVSDAIDAMVRTTAPLPYDRVLAHAGLQLRPRAGRGASFGVRVRNDGGRPVLTSVLRGSAAEAAGLAPGDEIIGLDGRRVDDASFRERLRHRKPGDVVDVMFARREAIQSTKVTLAEPPAEAIEIVPMADASHDARGLGEAWLGGGSSSLWNSK
jgi:predicted metalloprotease with PDZ domain